MVTNDSIKAASRAMRDLSLDAAQEMRVMPTWLRDANPGPEEQATTAEDGRMVWEALSQLTPKQRAAVVLRYFLDMRDREIARELDRSLSSIKWSIHAAKERLRSLLRRADPQEGSLPPKSKGDRGPGESR
jgi:RNA polymerase sigma-70 factor (ECF subfamily)